MDRLLKLLPVSRELLDAGFTLQVPQADGAVMTCGGDDELQVPFVTELVISFTHLLQKNNIATLT